MKYLVDTNIFSLACRGDKEVLAWLSANAALVATSSHVIAEIEYGIRRLPQSKKRKDLESWLTKLKQSLGSRILPFNSETGVAWAELEIASRQKSQPFPLPDAYIAATAIAHSLVLVTNDDFFTGRTELKTFNPLDSQGK